MGASKTYIYSDTELKTAKIGRAMSHPARIRILQLLNQKHLIRNIDLTNELQLAKSTVHDHIIKLKDADLIDLEFFPNCYVASLKNDALALMSTYLHN